MNTKNKIVRRLQGKNMEQTKFDLSFWVAIAHYEDINPAYPFDDYFRLDNRIGTDVGSYDLNQRFAKIILHLNSMITIIKNAQDRLNANVDVNKYNKLIEGLR